MTQSHITDNAPPPPTFWTLSTGGSPDAAAWDSWKVHGISPNELIPSPLTFELSLSARGRAVMLQVVYNQAPVLSARLLAPFSLALGVRFRSWTDRLAFARGQTAALVSQHCTDSLAWQLT